MRNEHRLFKEIYELSISFCEFHKESERKVSIRAVNLIYALYIEWILNECHAVAW